jgi:MYXO-CTERM domain-containing protein
VPSQFSEQPALTEPLAFDALDNFTKPEVEEVTKCWGEGGYGADAGASNGGGAAVVAAGRVGFLDWVQLKAENEASFTSWLDANGYPYDSAAKSVFDYYVGKSWYFVAFKIIPGTGDGGNTCQNLGPIKLTFPSTIPVVPSRMATAGKIASSGGYPFGFTWRIFGIADGAKQVDFELPNYNDKLSFSRLLDEATAGKLGGLAQTGDRVTSLEMWFDTAAANDVPLTITNGENHRETVTSVHYVNCPDAGDGGKDAADASDAADAHDSADTDAATRPDSSSGTKADGSLDTRDAGAADSGGTQLSAPDDVGGGCQTSPGSAAGSWAMLPLAAAIGLLAKRRRRATNRQSV